ncbi:E3 ubiquitin-protein ligase RNF26 [Hippocampus zosterae]|uniref:E3 ubiquitin-protein ligase RNF26 n=1 Tax=Hippocampus zosterae TaxID=109293 RepID=UPI00223D1EE0|nr:E3 ubiquitin-protein ligase RNF26 [Hippocampus zosterae]XP_051933916.1 E3 ubiquitin-protein ligase RNF26 [Hippocampus zosterae]XP_051933918.1 E3 ubiquitin-protein ligase RNF26 [Hippocampus zosterae]
MGPVNVVISTVGKCLDVVSLMLDVNYLLVHTVVRTILTVSHVIINLPALFVYCILELCNLVALFLLSTAVTMSHIAQGAAAGLMLSLEGVLESLKMVGYLLTHMLLRGKEQLCRGLLSLLEACGIALSLMVYLVNMTVNYALIAALNLHSALLSVWQTVSSPLQMALELTLTSITFLYSSLIGTSAFLWSPCKLALDFLASLVHIFVSIFILNTYGLVLTVGIALTTTAYLNPEVTRQASQRLMAFVNSFPALRTLSTALHSTLCLIHGVMRHLHRLSLHLYLLERRIWQQLSRHSSQLSVALRMQLHGQNRAGTDPDGEVIRRDPPDGRAEDHQREQSASSSTVRPLKAEKLWRPPAENLLTLLNEQEHRKMCVICHDCAKTVVLLPCRHLCLCRGCTDILLHQPFYQHNCPLCRRIIFDTIEVYL